MYTALNNLRNGLWMRTQSPRFRMITVLTLAITLGTNFATSMAAAQASASATAKTNNTQKEPLPWERKPADLRAAVETNKLALKLIAAVFDARLRRFEAESKFTPKVAPTDRNDPLSGPNDLAGSPLLQEFGQGAVWLSIIMSANKSDLSPQLQEVQRELLEGLPQHQTTNSGAIKKEIRKPIRSKDVEKADTTHEIQQVLQVERNFQDVVSQLQAAFPQYAELYLHQFPRLLNQPGEPTVFELTDPTVSADPLVKNERMQASLLVRVYRYDEHNFKIVSFWLYRNIEDPEMFVPRFLHSDNDKSLTSNYLGRWDWNHMPPREFSSTGYVSPPVTVLGLKFIEGEPVMTGRSTPAGRHTAQEVNLAQLNLNKLEPASGVLDASAPSFPVPVPDIPKLPSLALKKPALGKDYMPRIREPYEFHTNAEYEAYQAGIREALDMPPNQPAEVAESHLPTTDSPVAASASAGEPPVPPSSVPANLPSTPMNVERLTAIFLNPTQETNLNELSTRARDSLRQYSDLQLVSAHNLINQLFGKSNAGLRNHDPAAELLQQKLPKVREVNVYFFASNNTTASWRGPDDTSGKGGIVIILPTRYYSDPQQLYKNVAGSLINQPLASEDVATLSNYLGGASARPLAAIKQFPIETDYLDHGWDENGDMRRWTDEAVDFFRHLQEAVAYLKPRLETMDPDKRAVLGREISGVEDWLSSLGDASVTVNFGLYKGKDNAPPPKADSSTRTIWISNKAEEYIKAENREYRWVLLAKLIEGFNGLKGGSFDPGITGAIYDILDSFGKDKDNKLMIAWRLNTDLPAKPAEWPVLAGVTRAPVTTPALAPASVMVAATPAAPVAATPVASSRVIPVSATEIVSQKITNEPAQAPVLKPPVTIAQSAPKDPALAERPPQAAQPAGTPGIQQADTEFGKQVSSLIRSQMKGIDDAGLRATILQTMLDRLTIVRDSNPNFHSKVSSIDLKEPDPKHFDFTVNKTEYFDALFLLAEKAPKSHDVAWSSFEANLATVEYAAGNHDFGPLYATLQSDLTAIVKRHTDANGSVVSQDIFDDPQFKALLPYYSSFWSNWQFAGESARFKYLHDHVSSQGLRQLANEAGKSPTTKSLKPELLRLADELDLFYGEAVPVTTALPAVGSNAGLPPNSLEAPNALDNIYLSESDKRHQPQVFEPPTRLRDMKDYQMTQVIELLQKVQQPGGQRLQYQDNYRSAFVIYQLLDAWNRMNPDRQKQALAGEWKGLDLRFAFPILAEIHAGKLSTPLDSSAIVKLSGDMPWIVDPKFDLTKGAFDKLPDTLQRAP